MRRFLVVVVLAGLVLGGLGVGSAVGDDVIRSQWYVEPMELDVLRSRGLDGSGVTIAIIDGPVDVSVPELRGADITVKDACGAKIKVSQKAHGTNVASVLASPEYGWAPKAKYLNYVAPIRERGEKSNISKECSKAGKDTLGWLINQAVADGVDLITISMSDDATLTDGYAVANAALHKVPVVMAAGNDQELERLMSSLNYVVGVGATDRDGQRASFNNRGPALSVMAPGVDILVRRPDSGGELTRVESAYGTSYAAPMVAGALALAMQAHPGVDSDQLLQGLVASAARFGDEWDPKIGWGRLYAVGLVDSDPGQFPAVNPFAEKNPDSRLTPEMFADYRDGLVNPALLFGDEGYVYRGDNEAICELAARCELGSSPRFLTASPSPSVSPEPGLEPQPEVGGSGLSGPVLVAGLGVVLAVGLGAVIVVRRRRSADTNVD